MNMGMDFGVIEVVVNCKKNTKMQVLQVILIIVGVLFILAGLQLMYYIGLWALIPIAIGALACVGAYFCYMNVIVDYEYSLVDHELRIAKIMNKEKRKDMGKYDLDRMEILAPYQSHRLDGIKHRQNQKEMDFSSRSKEKTQTDYGCSIEGKSMLVLDLGGEDGTRLFDAIRSFAPGKVFKD